jgi:hypothetical protein
MLRTKISGIRINSFTSTLPKNSIVKESKPIYKSLFHQTTSDLGFDAAKRLLDNAQKDKSEIGFLLFGSKTPDYRSPITAGILQGRLSLPIDCICYDINVGINGFAQMTQIGSSVLKNINKKYGLLIFGDTPSKLHRNSPDVEYFKSDAATAVLLEKVDDFSEIQFINFSLGEYSEAIILRQGGFRNFKLHEPFDSTEFKNFVVQENEGLMKLAIDSLDLNHISEFVKGTKTYYHSEFLKYTGDSEWIENQPRIIADSSELPILLASDFNVITSEEMSFVSIGEGVSLYGMKVNSALNFLETTHSDEVFDDFRVNHDM